MYKDNAGLYTTIWFYIGEAYPERRDSRVRALDFDEVTQSTKVEFPDGYTAVVSVADLVSREA